MSKASPPGNAAVHRAALTQAGPSSRASRSMLLGLSQIFSDDIAIDLGTANTLVYVAGKGIVIDEPSAVAVLSRNGSREVVAVGARAKAMAGRAPADVEIIRPLRDGVIADFIATEQMLRVFISRTRRRFGFRRPRIIICVPAGATPVERRAVYESAISAGGRRVLLIEEPVAASIGAGIRIDESSGSMVVDIGGGTTDIAVMLGGGVIQTRSLRCAGNAMDEAIIRYVRRRHRLLIGEASAERIKIEAGSASRSAEGRAVEVHIRGRDVESGTHKTVVLGPRDVADALDQPIEQMADLVRGSLEDLPPDLAADVCARGIYLTGGGALLDQLNLELERRVGAAFVVPERAMHCVIAGTAAVLENLASRERLLIKM
jgi:rod shape-determining protein MreB